MVSKGRKDRIVISPAKGYTCEKISLDNALRFVLGVETEDWEITSSEGGFYDGVKVLHVHLSNVGSPGRCPDCHIPMVIHDYKDREWRHENLGETVWLFSLSTLR